MIIKSMGSSVPADGASRTLCPLIEDDKPWRAVAHYDKADDAYLLLVDGDGTVRLADRRAMPTDAAYFASSKKKLDGHCWRRAIGSRAEELRRERYCYKGLYHAFLEGFPNG